MDRELLIEIGTEELPARWLPGLTAQFGARLEARLAEWRIPSAEPVETFSTPRRLVARVARIPERQTGPRGARRWDRRCRRPFRPTAS